MRKNLLAASAGGVAAWSLADALRRGDFVWSTGGVSKRRWIALQLLVPWAGSAHYWRRIRPRLVTAEQALHAQGG